LQVSLFRDELFHKKNACIEIGWTFEFNMQTLVAVKIFTFEFTFINNDYFTAWKYDSSLCGDHGSISVYG
jgi:hypothetical protein